MRKLIKNRNGFTLIEIMVVTGIITLLAGTSIPHLVRGRLNANENAVASTLRTYSSSLQSFLGMNAATGYPATLAGLDPVNEPAYIQEDLAVANPTRNGYNFSYTQVAGVSSVQYHIYAGPVTPDFSGTRGFYIDEQGVLSAIPVAAGEPGHAPAGSVAPVGYVTLE